MPNKKLTDNEIVKALEYCITSENADCSKCPYKDLATSEKSCGQIHGEDLLDLINRQKAENKRLKAVKGQIDILIHRNCEYPTAEAYNKAFQKALEKLYDNTNAKSGTNTCVCDRTGKQVFQSYCFNRCDDYEPLPKNKIAQRLGGINNGL